MRLDHEIINRWLRRLPERVRNNLFRFWHTRNYVRANVRMAACPVHGLDRRLKVVTLMSCYNHFDFTEKGISSYYTSLDDKYDHALVLLDDCSTSFDGDVPLRKFGERPNFYYIRFTKNKGLTRSWNHGIDFAINKLHADFVVIANDDIIIPRGAVGRLIDTLRTSAETGIIGALTNSPGMHRATQDIRNYMPDYAPSDQAADIERVSQRVSSNPTVSADEINGFFWAGQSEVFLKNRFRFLSRYYFFDPKNANFKNELEFQSRLRKIRPSAKILVAANTFIFHYKDISQGRSQSALNPHAWGVFRPQ